MKQKGFASVLIILLLAGAFLGLFILFFRPTSKTNQPPTVVSTTKKYTNDTYGIEFQYDKGLVIDYERKNGKTFINGAEVGPQYAQHTINDPGPIVSFMDSTINSKDKDGKFSIEIFPTDSDNGQCSRWIWKNKVQKSFNNILYDYGEYYDVYNVFIRHACVVHGKFTWLLSISNQHKENEVRSGEVFSKALSTFKFD